MQVLPPGKGINPTGIFSPANENSAIFSNGLWAQRRCDKKQKISTNGVDFLILYIYLRTKLEIKLTKTVTAALPYANGPLHLGHLAGAYLPADIYVRYLRLKGEDVAFICGSDEHGAAITIRAKKEGISPRDIIDKYHALNKSSFERLGISFDIYHRTSDPLHHETAKAFFKDLVDKGGQFEVKEEQQYYDDEFKQFLADRFIKGTCPHCGHTEAFGDQCEKCGKDLSPTELINPVSTLSEKTPILKTTKHWYFKLQDHEAWLRDFISKGILEGTVHHSPKSWRDQVVGQCMSWLENGLQSRAITRDLDWGVPIVDIVGEEGKDKVLYVWFDAPLGYISATKAWAEANGKDWKKYWLKKEGHDTQLIHFIGKDNIVFHCIVFPAMLKAQGDYLLPTNVPANQFLNFEGQKFSKSRGWGIEQHQYLEDFNDFENKEDALRFYLSKILPEQKDADFRWDDFASAHDNELVANIGNFVHRTLSLTEKYYGGKVPAFDTEQPFFQSTFIFDGDWPVYKFGDFQKKLIYCIKEYSKSIENFELREALKLVLALSSTGNAILQHNAPWSFYKTDPNHPIIHATLAAALEVTAVLQVLLTPFLPFTSDKLGQMLGLEKLASGAGENSGALTKVVDTLEKGERLLQEGHSVNSPTLLFAKINDQKDSKRLDIVNKQKEKLEEILTAETQKQPSTKNQPQTINQKEMINYEDFAKLDIRTATIKDASKVEGADKLLKIELELGTEQRTVVSGIALHYKPEDIIGRQVLYLYNLSPRKLRGIESSGMILMAENEAGELSFVSPEKSGFGVGAKVS